MSQLEHLLQRKLWDEVREEGFRRELAERVFTDWRDRYLSSLAAYIRVHRNAREAGVTVPTSIQNPAWCNAAIHLLSIPSDDIQDYFLRADPDLKNQLVQAVLKDGGITNSVGYFVELPPL